MNNIFCLRMYVVSVQVLVIRWILPYFLGEERSFKIILLHFFFSFVRYVNWCIFFYFWSIHISILFHIYSTNFFYLFLYSLFSIYLYIVCVYVCVSFLLTFNFTIAFLCLLKSLKSCLSIFSIVVHLVPPPFFVS